MNLYLLTWPADGLFVDLDVYDQCVVIAENEEQARYIHPDYNVGSEISLDECWAIDAGEEWAKTPEEVGVKLLGSSVYNEEPCVVLASYIPS